MSDTTSQPSSPAAISGKLTLFPRAIKHSGIRLEVFSLQNRKSFEHFVCFHRTLGISSEDLGGFKGDIAFIYSPLACSLTMSRNLNLILTFVTRNLIGSFVIRCAFWLVSRKDDCLKHVLRNSFWIKKLINTYLYSLIWTLAGLREFSKVMQTLDWVPGLHNFRVENSPNPPVFRWGYVNIKSPANMNNLFFFHEGTVTNPAIWLVLSAVRIFLSLTTVTVTAGNSAGEIVMFS